jgi:hypothetical protein
MPGDSEKGDQIVRVTAESAAAMLAAGAGVMGSPEAAVLMATAAPALTEAFVRIATKVSSIRIRRCAEVYSQAAVLSDMSIEELTERVISDDGLMELSSRVLLAAQDIALSQKRRGLARTLAATALEPTPARLDIAFLIDSAIRDLDNGHIRFMTVLSSQPRRPAVDAPPGKYGLIVAEVVKCDPGLGEGAYALLQGLISHGLVEDSTGGVSTLVAGKTFTLSALGQRLYAILSDEGFEHVYDYTEPI